MNLAHVHLILNHIPVIGIPIALIFLGYGLHIKNQSSQRFALLVLVGLAAIVLPVYLTGEPAEELVEHMPGVGKGFIEAHEDAALFSLILTLITGVAAFIALWLQKDPKQSRVVNFGVMSVAILSVLSLLYTSNLGGKVRRTELQSGAVAIQNEAAVATPPADDLNKMPTLEIADADRACIQDSDCEAIGTACSCSCGGAVNIISAPKYAAQWEALCKNYQGKVCKINCNGSISCKNKLCTYGE